MFKLFGWLRYASTQVLKTEALQKVTLDNKPQTFKMIIGLKLQFYFKYLVVWCTNSTLVRYPNLKSFPKFNMELLGLQWVICILKKLYLKRIRKNMTQTTLEGIKKENVSFLTAQHKRKEKKKPVIQWCHWDFFLCFFILAGMLCDPTLVKWRVENKRTLKNIWSMPLRKLTPL